LTTVGLGTASNARNLHGDFPASPCKIGTIYNRDMPKDAAELLRDALALSPESRAALADSLLESLDDAVDADAEEAWSVEIQRRLTEIESGSVDMIPWEEAERRLAARLQR